MRIGIDGLILHGRYSGVEHYVHQLVLALRRADDQNEYIVYVPRDADTEELEGDKVTVRRAALRGPQRLRRIAWEQFVLPAALAAEGVDVVHGPAYVLPLRARCKRVLTIHDTIVFARPDLAKATNRWHYRRVVPRAVAVADHIIALSAHTKSDLMRHLGVPEEKVTVSWQGLRDVFRPVTDPSELEAVRARYELPDRFFLFVGQIEPKKNVMACIEAMLRYAQSGAPEAKLVIAGEVGWRALEFLRAMRDPAVQTHVHYVGYVGDQELASLYSLATALLFPSLYEGVGMPPLEAMACGCPAIVSDAASLPELVGDAAVIVPLSAANTSSGRGATAGRLADAMRSVAEDDRFREELVSRGFDRTRQFSWRQHARDVLAVYRRCVS